MAGKGTAMTDWDSDYLVNYGSRNAARDNTSTPEYYYERPGGVTVVAVVLTLAILANIVTSFIAMGTLSNDDYLYSQSTIDATRGVLWVNILSSLPVFVFVAGLFGKGAWARAGLISYLCCNGVFLLISLLASSSYQWISLLCDIAIIVYMARDEVGDAYVEGSGKGWGIASGIGLVGVQVIAIFLILHSAS
jgi:hypothetical protein